MRWSYVLLAGLGLAAVVLAAIAADGSGSWSSSSGGTANTPLEEDLVADADPDVFYYNFEQPGVLQEAPSSERSSSRYWWLDSGGSLEIRDGTGRTMQGDAEALSRWRLAYSRSNPRDTDDGRHPQNLFRLLTQQSWLNSIQEAYFRITRVNLSHSEYRNESNGIFLMSRYQDGDNLYYAGIRVDGAAVIKRKSGGTYYTLAQAPFFAADAAYERNTNPNLIPGSSWIGLRSEVSTSQGNAVAVRLWIDRDRAGDWRQVLSVIDAPDEYGGAPITTEGRAGIRTDFMDVEFSDFKVEKI